MFHFLVQEQDLIDIGDEASSNDDDKGSVDERATLAIRFPGKHFPELEEQ
jgi:hypothetical protein